MEKKQAPINEERKKNSEKRRGLIRELHELSSKLSIIVVPSDHKFVPVEKKEDKKPYNPDTDEKLQDTIKCYKEFKDNSGDREAKINSLSTKADEINAMIKKLKTGLVAHSKEENERMRRRLEVTFETGSLSPKEEKNVVQQLKSLNKEMAFTSSGRNVNDANERKAIEAIDNACRSNVSNVLNVSSTYNIPIYTVIDELTKQEKRVREHIDTLKGSDSKKSRSSQAEELMGEINKKIAEIKKIQSTIDDLSKKSDDVYNEFKTAQGSQEEVRKQINKKRNEKYNELLREKRKLEREEFNKQKEAEKQAKIQKWMDFINAREKAINDIISAVTKLGSGKKDGEDEKTKKQNKDNTSNRDERRSPIFSFTRMIEEIENLADQLTSMHINYEIRSKGKGCKEADEAFAKLIKKDEEKKDNDVKMIPTKKEQEKELRSNLKGKKASPKFQAAKTVSLDDFIGEEVEEDGKKAEGGVEAPKLSEGQLYTLEENSITAPKAYSDIPAVVENLKKAITTQIENELKHWNDDLERIKALREEFVNPPAEKLEEKNTATTTDPKKPKQVRSQFWFYVPDGLYKEAFLFREEGWPEKLGIARKPRRENNTEKKATPASNEKGKNNNNNNKNTEQDQKAKK